MKCALANATLMFPKADASLTLMINVYSTVVGARLQLYFDHSWQPLKSFLRHCTAIQTRYNVFSRELLAIYLCAPFHQRQALRNLHGPQALDIVTLGT